MLKEIGLYGSIDKVARAMARLRLHEPPEGYKEDERQITLFGLRLNETDV